MSNINKIIARQIIDSRGNPTIEVEVTLGNGLSCYASAPSGASTGKYEAKELRDLSCKEYRGTSVLSAVNYVNTEINKCLSGLDPFDQEYIDKKLIELDGTEDKSRIGANSIIAASIAVAKVAAKLKQVPLYHYLGGSDAYHLPIPMMNIINGGMHADNKLDLQEFMIAPIKAQNFTDSIKIGMEIFHTLKSLLKSCGQNINVGDEGGFAPNFNSSHEALDSLVKAIEIAGYVPGEDVYIAIDAAISDLYSKDKYHLKGEGKILTKAELVDYYSDLCDKYPIYSIEDGMAEDDFEGWKLLTDKLVRSTQLVGDDLIVTNPKILKKIIEQKIANAVLIKPNQIGTVTETLSTINLAHTSGYKTIISHRSGETEDVFISHLAVGLGASQIKAGSLSRGERVAKYNELIRIEEKIKSFFHYEFK